jgi:hypothetical protein
MKKLLLPVIIASMLFSSSSIAQNVGIGNTSPTEKLDVTGNINVTGTIKANGADGAANQVLMKNASGLLSWGDMCEFKNKAIFTTAGALSWTVPAGVTRICVELWGGGGGGNTYGGGGGGGYIRAVFTVAPGDNIGISVGTGGGGAGTGNATNGNDTEATVGAYTAIAGGGQGAASSTFSDGGFGLVSGGYTNYMVLRDEGGRQTTPAFYNNGSTYYETCTGGDGGSAGNSLYTGGHGTFRMTLAASPWTTVKAMSPDQGKQPGGGGGSGFTILSNPSLSNGVTGGLGMAVINY